MLKYVKDIQENGRCGQVGEGTNISFYKSIGMTEMEIEKGYDGAWYVKGHAPSPSEEENFAYLRSERDRLLQETDKYLSVSDLPISDEKKEEYRVYRQALRDLPSLPDAPWTPDTIPWPSKPE